MKINVLHIVLSLLFLFCHQNGKGQIIVVPTDLNVQKIGKSIAYWEDANCDASIEFVFQNKDSLDFQPYQKDFFTYDQPNSCPWIYFQLVNPSDKNIQLQLRLDNHKLSVIKWHTFRKGVKVNSEITGDNLFFSQRPVQHLNYIFPTELVAGDTLDCYLFLYRGTNVIYSNIYIQTMDEFIGVSAIKNYKMGILLGISFFFVIIALVILILFRTKLLLFYFLMILFMFIFSIAMEGIGFQYIWGDGGKFAARFVSIFSPLVQIISFISFGVLYFKTKQLHPKAHRLLWGLFGIIGMLIFVGLPIMILFKDSFFHYKAVTRILVYFFEGVIIAAFLIILSIAIQEYRKRKDIELIAFMMVIIVYLFFLVAFFLQTTGAMWVTEILEYSLLPSFIFEMIVLTFIIFRNYRKNLLEKEKLEISYNQNQIKIANALLQGEELERRRIASDLHDSLGSLLSMVKLFLSQVDFKDKVIVENWVAQAHTKTRSISQSLMPKSLFTLGLIAAIEDRSVELEKTKDVKILLVNNELSFPYNDSQKTNIYRLVNELLQVAINESSAKHITIYLTQHKDELNLIIEDDGKGNLNKEILQNKMNGRIMNRVKAMKADLICDSILGRGTSVVIDFNL